MEDQLIIFGGEVKALGDGRVGGYLVRFTDENELDLEDEFFDAQTDYGLLDQSTTYYNHGLDPTLGRKVLGDVAHIGADEVGIWIKHQLDLRDEYEQAVYGMAEAGKMAWSSGTAPHLVEREPRGKGMYIKKWPLGLDSSYTPTPADPGNRAMPLKAWAETVKSLEGVLEVDPVSQENSQRGDTGTATADGITVNVTVNQSTPVEEAPMEVKKMSEEKEKATTPVETPEPVDVKAIAKAAAEEAVKAYRAELEKAPPTNDPGYAVEGVEDQADRALKGGFKRGLGGLLLAIADAETPGPIDERLLPLRATEKDLKGYFDLSKAMPEVVGSPRDALKSTKAPTGLGELIPSAGGFLVGTDRAGSIMGRTYQVGELLRRVDMVGISAGSNAMTFYGEDETSRATGSRRGGIRFYWAAEAAEKLASKPKFREMELKLHKAIGLVYATDELLADASALEGWIMNNLPEELAFGVEDAIIRGTGAGQPLGILNSGSLVTVAAEVGQAATTIVAENISNMYARRWLGGRDYIWLHNQDIEPELDNLAYPVGTGGALVYMPPGGLADAAYGRLKGRSAVPSEYPATLGTTGDLILADMSQYQMIDKGGIESASSIHVRFVYDETVFRFVYRVDGQPKWDAPLTPYQGTNTVSPFVVVATR